MEAKELRDLSAGDLAQKRASLREEICHLKLKRATSRLENPMEKALQAERGGA
jgi:large subunit ribosomal protein L29